MFGKAVDKFHMFVIFHSDRIRLCPEGTVGKHGQTAALDMDLHLAAGVEGIKDDVLGIFQYDMGEEQLTASKAIAAVCAQDPNSHTAVSVRMVEGTSHRRAMRVVRRLSLGIINEEGFFVAIKAAVHENIVAAVVDTAVTALACHDGIEHMVFAEIGNIDTTIIAQAPKMAPYIEKMRKKIADAVKTDIKNVSVKAKSNEKMGFTGRSEGIEVRAIVLLTE